MRVSSLIPSFLINSNTRQVLSAHWSDRKFILDRDVNLYCWERALSPEIQQFLNNKIAENPEKLSIMISQKNLVGQMADARRYWGKEDSKGETLFWMDVIQLASDFLHFSVKGKARLYLKVVDTDSCTKFHIDGYNLRLFSTYLGPGTMWLPERAVNRSALGKSNDLIVKDNSAVQQMSQGNVAILKGEVPNEKNITKGIVHRSPTISESGQKRIILRIDL